MGPTGCPETSVRHYHYSLRNNPEEHSFHLLRGESLKSQNREVVPAMVHYAYDNSDFRTSFGIQERKRFGKLISYSRETARMGRYKTTEARWLLPPLTPNQSEIK